MLHSGRGECQSDLVDMSAPNENVRFVPNRNVRLTKSGWRGARTRSSHHEPARSRPAGSSQKREGQAHPANRGGRAVGDHDTTSAAIAGALQSGRRPGDGAWAAGSRFEPQTQCGKAGRGGADTFSAGLSRIRADSGGRVSGQTAWAPDRPRESAPDYDPSRVMASAAAECGGGARLATAAQCTGRTSAVGHFRSRLAGGAWRAAAVSDPHDRRCHQRVGGAIRSQRLDHGEPPTVGAIPAKARTAAGFLHRQGEFIPDHRQAAARHSGPGNRSGGDGANPDWPRVARVGDRLDRGAFPASQRTSGAQLPDRAGSAGEGIARSRRAYCPGCQSLSRTRVPAVVESASDGAACQPHRCASAARCAARSSRDSECGGDAHCGQRLHFPVPRPAVSDRTTGYRHRTTRRHRACRNKAGWNTRGALWFPLRFHQRMPTGAKTGASQTGHPPPATSRTGPCFRACSSYPQRPSATSAHADLAGRRHRSDQNGSTGLKIDKECRANTARLALALYSPRPSLGDSTQECRCRTKPSAYAIVDRGLSRFFGASPVASAFGIRPGATPAGHPQPNIIFSPIFQKPDISIWQKSGHSYLAATHGTPPARIVFACKTILVVTWCNIRSGRRILVRANYRK